MWKKNRETITPEAAPVAPWVRLYSLNKNNNADCWIRRSRWQCEWCTKEIDASWQFVIHAKLTEIDTPRNKAGSSVRPMLFYVVLSESLLLFVGPYLVTFGCPFWLIALLSLPSTYEGIIDWLIFILPNILQHEISNLKIKGFLQKIINPPLFSLPYNNVIIIIRS